HFHAYVQTGRDRSPGGKGGGGVAEVADAELVVTVRGRVGRNVDVVRRDLPTPGHAEHDERVRAGADAEAAVHVEPRIVRQADAVHDVGGEIPGGESVRHQLMEHLPDAKDVVTHLEVDFAVHRAAEANRSPEEVQTQVAIDRGGEWRVQIDLDKRRVLA